MAAVFSCFGCGRQARRGVFASPSTSGITATPVSNPDRPSASFGNTSSATSSIVIGIAVLDEQSFASTAADTPGDWTNFLHAPQDDDDVQREIDGDDHDGEPDGFPESFQEHGAEQRQQHQRHATG